MRGATPGAGPPWGRKAGHVLPGTGRLAGTYHACGPTNLPPRPRCSSCSRQRRAAAGRLGAAVQAVLGDLAMAGSRFEVRLAWAPLSAAAGIGHSSGGSSSSGDLAIGAADAASCGQAEGAYRVRPGGLDSAEFLFAAGPGEPLRPLAAVASGGESARLMLALKAAPAYVAAGGEDGTSRGSSVSDASSSTGGSGGAGSSWGVGSQIMILDEIDSGVGARLGQPIGRILRRMAGASGERASQILCVSHLPQASRQGLRLGDWGPSLGMPQDALLCLDALCLPGEVLKAGAAFRCARSSSFRSFSALRLVPQVAAHGEHHLCVRKAVAADSRVVTEFEPLSRRPERLREISAMLGLPEAAAEELLHAAAQP